MKTISKYRKCFNTLPKDSYRKTLIQNLVETAFRYDFYIFGSYSRNKITNKTWISDTHTLNDLDIITTNPTSIDKILSYLRSTYIIHNNNDPTINHTKYTTSSILSKSKTYSYTHVAPVCLDIIPRKLEYNSQIIFYQLEFNSISGPQWNFRIDMLYQPLMTPSDIPSFITTRNDFVHNCCYLNSNRLVKFCLPERLTDTYLSNYIAQHPQSLLAISKISSQQQLVSFLCNHKYLLPFNQDSWFYLPYSLSLSTNNSTADSSTKSSPHGSPHGSPDGSSNSNININNVSCQKKIKESLNLWKRYRKYHLQGYRFYPESLPDLYDPSRFQNPYFKKSQQSQSDDSCCCCCCCHDSFRHYYLTLDSGESYHIGCVFKRLQQYTID